MGRDAMELPVIRGVSSLAYRNYFRRPYRNGNLYLGVFDTYEAATAEARRLASDRVPPDYDQERTVLLYREQIRSIRACDYPAVHWLGRALEGGARRVFDLGGHVGVAYYGFSRYLAFPADLSWRVHDLSHAMEAGAMLAETNRVQDTLGFTPNAGDASGCDFLISTGALQYLPYRLPELLAGLGKKPRHVLFNLTPLHPEKSFFTLQNLGIAICPYRIESAERLFGDMEALHYRMVDRWELPERRLRVPFHDGFEVECYHGACFAYEPPTKPGARPAAGGTGAA